MFKCIEGTPLQRLMVLKNKEIVQSVSNMSVKDKRKIFSVLRKSQPFEGINIIFPEFAGITLGEFCTAHVLQTDNKRKRKISRQNGQNGTFNNIQF